MIYEFKSTRLFNRISMYKYLLIRLNDIVVNYLSELVLSLRLITFKRGFLKVIDTYQ